MVGEDDQGDPTWFIGHLEQFKFKAVIGNSRKILISRTCPSFKDSNEKKNFDSRISKSELVLI